MVLLGGMLADGIEPPTYASQKRRATSALHPVRITAARQQRWHQGSSHPSLTRVGFPILFSLGDMSTDVFQSVCVYYNPTYVLCQMEPSAPIHICELDAYR